MNRNTYAVTQDDLYCFLTGRIDRYGQTLQVLLDHGLRVENCTVRFNPTVLKKSLLEVAAGGRLELVGDSCLVVDRNSALRIFSNGELQIAEGSLRVEAGGTFWCCGKIQMGPRGSLWLHGERISRRKTLALQAVAKVVLKTEKYCEAFVHGPDGSHDFAGWAIQLLPDGERLERTYGWWIAAVTLLGWEASHYFFEDREQIVHYLNRVLVDNP